MMCAKCLGTCTTDLRFIYHYLDNTEKSRIKCSFFQLYKIVYLTETVSWYDKAIKWHRKPPNYSSILDIFMAKYMINYRLFMKRRWKNAFWLHTVSVFTK